MSIGQSLRKGNSVVLQILKADLVYYIIQLFITSPSFVLDEGGCVFSTIQ